MGQHLPNKTRHSMELYGLALLLACGALDNGMPQRIGFWPPVLRRILAKHRACILELPEQVLKKCYVMLYKIGIRPKDLPTAGFSSFGKALALLEDETQDTATQTDQWTIMES